MNDLRPLRPLLILAVLLPALFPSALRAAEWGPRAGVTDGPGDFYVGVELDTDAHFGPARFVPSLDLEVGDVDATALNGDLRWELLPVPDTGLAVYAKAGLSLFLADGGNELGLALTPGLQIPMRNGRRLQIEVRFGFQDTPDRKIGAAVLLPF